MKNKVTTCGYFIKRLRDNGYTVNRIFNEYSTQDCRKWTVMIEPRIASLYITCYVNKDWNADQMFELNDGVNFKNLQLKTDSMEVILAKLVDKMKKKGIRVFETSPNRFRIVTHYGIIQEDVERALIELKEIIK